MSDEQRGIVKQVKRVSGKVIGLSDSNSHDDVSDHSMDVMRYLVNAAITKQEALRKLQDKKEATDDK